MTQFAAVLRAAMTDMAVSQEELAERTGTSQPSLSRFLLGNGLPKAASLERICREFPENVREALIAAYLTDQIPPSAASLVQVTTVKESGDGKTHYHPGRAPVGSLLRRDLDVLERRAIKDPTLAKMINYLASMVEGISPSTDYFEPEETGSVREDPRVKEARRKLSERDGN